MFVFAYCPQLDVYHGFTAWESDAYNPLADFRSWDAMLEVFTMLLSGEGAMLDLNVTEESVDAAVSASENPDLSIP